MKKKLKLEKIKIESFVTQMPEEFKQTYWQLCVPFIAQITIHASVQNRSAVTRTAV